jgi:hypothetical protein
MIFDHPEENYCYSGKNRNNDHFNQKKICGTAYVPQIFYSIHLKS